MMKTNSIETYFILEETCRKKDNPTRKQPKHVPAAEICEYLCTLEFCHSTPYRRSTDSTTFLPVEVVVVQIYLTKVHLRLSLESVECY